jgi:hypothetical protein
MLRWLGFTTLLALALTAAGCGSNSAEIPAKKDAAPAKVTTQETMQKAMQGMPPEMQKKMAPQLEKMKREQPK